MDGDRLSITATTQPGHGTVSNDAGKTVTYTPQPGYVGTDAFGYEISDGHGGVANASVTVLVRNTAAATDFKSTSHPVTAPSNPLGDPISTPPNRTASADGIATICPWSGHCRPRIQSTRAHDSAGGERSRKGRR